MPGLRFALTQPDRFNRGLKGKGKRRERIPLEVSNLKT